MDSLQSTCRDLHINFTKSNNHIRCLAHVINLAVQDALVSLKVEYFDEDEILIQDKITNNVISKVKLNLYIVKFKLILIINIFKFIL